MLRKVPLLALLCVALTAQASTYQYRVKVLGIHPAAVAPAAPAAPAAPTGPADPYFSSVTLLLQGDSTIADTSGSPKTLSVTGTAKLDSTTFKVGTGALSFATNLSYLDAGSSPDFVFGTGDFTVETWAKSTAGQTTNGFFMMNDTTGGFACGFDSGAFRIGRRATSTELQYAYTTDQNWHHYACVRASGVAMLFIDGAKVAATADTVNYSVTGPARIGGFNVAGYTFVGFMDDFRVTKGVARYTANFTPATTAFPTH